MDEDHCKAETPESKNRDCCGRQSAPAVIEDQIRRLRKQADNLETILNALPRQLTREQDEALWQVFISIRNF